MDLSSGYPFWLIKDGLLHDYPKLEHDVKTNVIILGGGISGALSAYYLTKAGVECTLVDARTIGLGSTCASTALLQYELDEPLCRLIKAIGLKPAVRSYQLCVEAVKEFAELTSVLKFSGFQLKGSLYYAARKRDETLLTEEFTARKKYGFDVRYIESSALEVHYGFKAPGGILSRVGGQVNAYGLTHALLQRSMAAGLQVYDRTMVKSIDHGKHEVKLVTNNGFTMQAKYLVYATGYEVVNYINKKIVSLQSTYATVSEHSNSQDSFWKDDVMIWNTANPYLYMRVTEDHRIMVGGRDEKFSNPVRRDRLIKSKTAQLVNDFKDLYPNIAFRPEFSWTGTFGVTKDSLPYIGWYHKLPRGLFALGFGGNGIVFSLVAAHILTDLVLGKKNQDAEIFSFIR